MVARTVKVNWFLTSACADWERWCCRPGDWCDDERMLGSGWTRTRRANGVKVTTIRVTARLLLPGRLPDGTLLTWTDIASRSGWFEPVDGYTDWSRLVELRPGIDPAMLPVAAAGIVDDETSRRLLSALHDSNEVLWTWWPLAAWSDAAQSALLDASGAATQTASLVELLSTWEHGRFSGRADGSGSVIEAPPYADSLLVTSGPDVLARLLAVGLEVHEVTRALPIPIWRD